MAEEKGLVQLCIELQEHYKGKSPYALKVAYRQAFSEWQHNLVFKEIMMQKSSFVKEVWKSAEKSYGQDKRHQLAQCIPLLSKVYQETKETSITAILAAESALIPFALYAKNNLTASRREFIKAVAIMGIGGLAAGAGVMQLTFIAGYFANRGLVQQCYDQAYFLDDVIAFTYNRGAQHEADR